ncbi:hypothetical protein QR98_0022200 [Sarcoptes scabiei]|uniref:Uncharacterized protein n=1 Tax=Sarcoptes scabiei TaxID=52283 RepID=A0A131ZYA0_SARSC|nr:hypothetical protein QR98_0022200 [Sarcoptes scabiei]
MIVDMMMMIVARLRSVWIDFFLAPQTVPDIVWIQSIVLDSIRLNFVVVVAVAVVVVVVVMVNLDDDSHHYHDGDDDDGGGDDDGVDDDDDDDDVDHSLLWNNPN